MTTQQPARVILFEDGVGTEASDVAQARRRLTSGHGWLWIEVEQPSTDQLNQLIEHFDLHPQTVQHSVETCQRPRFSRLGELATLVLHPVAYHDDTDVIEVGQLSLLVGPDYLICLLTGPSTGGVADARERLLAAPRLASLGPRAGCYVVLDDVVDDFQPAADGLEEDIDEIDDQLAADVDRQVATRIYKLSRQVTALLSAVTPLEGCINQLRKTLIRHDVDLLEPGSTANALVGDPDGHRLGLLDALFADVSAHVLRIEDRADGMRATLTNALALTSTLAAQKATDISLVQNDQTKKVSSWAAIFAVPAIVTGVFGMNFAQIPGLHWQYGFAVSMVVMGVLCVALYLVFKKYGWL